MSLNSSSFFNFFFQRIISAGSSGMISPENHETMSMMVTDVPLSPVVMYGRVPMGAPRQHLLRFFQGIVPFELPKLSGNPDGNTVEIKFPERTNKKFKFSRAEFIFIR